MEDFGLPGQEKIFINSSLSYYKMLWSKSKKLLNFGKIVFTFLTAPLESK